VRSLRQASAPPITMGMIWNDRDHLRKRLPAIIGLAMYIVFLAMVLMVLLGVSWLYVEHGPIAGWLAVAIITIMRYFE
jgi:apolipoprotein N-acyltransferase